LFTTLTSSASVYFSASIGLENITLILHPSPSIFYLSTIC